MRYITLIPVTTLQSWTKVLGTVLQYSYFLSFLGSLLKRCILFENFLQSPSPHPIQSWNPKKFGIHVSNIVCVVRGGVRPVWIGKRPRNAKVSQDLVFQISLYQLIFTDFWLLKNLFTWKTTVHACCQNTLSKHYKTLQLCYILKYLKIL